MSSKIRVVDYNSIDVSKINCSEINSKSFNTNNIYYGKMTYDGFPFNIYVKNFLLKSGMISNYEGNEKIYPSGKYDKNLFKAFLSLKDNIELSNVIQQIDEYIENNIAFSDKNGIYNDLENKNKELKNNNKKVKPIIKVYYNILKYPNIEKKKSEEKYKGKSEDEIINDIGTNIKVVLKIEGKVNNDKKYILEYNENSLIVCDIRKKAGVDIKIKKGEKKNLDFYRNTFKKGVNIDFVFQISNWWTKFDSSTNMCQVGIKCVMQTIIINDISSISVDKQFYTDDGHDIFEGCDDDEDDDNNEKEENVTSSVQRKQSKPVITDNHIQEIFDDDDNNEVDDNNFDKEAEIIDEKPDEQSSEEEKPKPKSKGRKK